MPGNGKKFSWCIFPCPLSIFSNTDHPFGTAGQLRQRLMTPPSAQSALQAGGCCFGAFCAPLPCPRPSTVSLMQLPDSFAFMVHQVTPQQLAGGRVRTRSLFPDSRRHEALLRIGNPLEIVSPFHYPFARLDATRRSSPTHLLRQRAIVVIAGEPRHGGTREISAEICSPLLIETKKPILFGNGLSLAFFCSSEFRNNWQHGNYE